MFILYTRNAISHEDAHRPYDPVSLELSQNTIIKPGVIALLEPKRWNTPDQIHSHRNNSPYWL